MKQITGQQSETTYSIGDRIRMGQHEPTITDITGNYGNEKFHFSTGGVHSVQDIDQSVASGEYQHILPEQ
jgi:hypothetical protein